jgi:hypothetical protein
MNVLSHGKHGGQHVPEYVQDEAGNPQSANRRSSAEQERLGEKLRDHAAPGGSQRGADRDLSATRRNTRQKQASHVAAGDEPDDGHRYLEGQKCGLDLAHQLIVDAQQADAVGSVALYKLRMHTCHKALKRLGLHAGVQADNRTP